jgi:two-component system response regulator YesN
MYKLLIIDDEAEIRIGLSNYFPWNQFGFEVAAQAENGIQALSVLESRHIDVALCDIKMPVMDGLAFCKEVCSRKLNLIIILLTGYKDFEFARSAIEYGVRKYLLKPTDHKEIAELFTRIREELNCATHAFGLKNNEKEIIIKSGNYYDRIINITKAYVQNNIQCATLESAADEVCMSAPYLSKLFKSKIGENFSDYLIAQKMEKAAELLRQTDSKVYEISEQVGYSNPNNFARTFKKYFGVTPYQYRKGISP